MDWYRIRHTICLHLTYSAISRARYMKKHNIFYHMGDDCMVMFRKIPLYPKLISIGNNVRIASDVTLVTHDVIHTMINKSREDINLQEHLGCVKIEDNVFIGADSIILPNVTIGSNTIVAAGSLVAKSLPGNGVYGGTPASYICSIDEFINKRQDAAQINIVRSKKGGLSKETIEDCWKMFCDTEERNR